MPLPPIAVEVAPSPQKPDLVELLLEACGRAASPVRCIRADQPNVSHVSALAIVVWQAGGDSVRIQVGSRRGEKSGDWVKRRISFEPSDEQGERWTATGFVVGTLASKFFDSEANVEQLETQNDEQAPALPATDARGDDEARKESPQRAPESDQERYQSPRWFWVDAAGVAGPLFETGPWRFGGMLGVAFRRDTWPVLALGSFRRSQRGPDANNVSANLTEIDLGVALPVAGGDSLSLDTSLALALERLRVSWDEPGALLKVPVTHWVLGARVRLELGYQFMDNVSGVAGVGVARWSHNTHFRIRSGEAVVATQPTLVPEASLTIRYQLR